MNKMQEGYVNALITDRAGTLKKSSTDGNIFVITRNVYDEIIESGVLDPESDIQLRIYNALLKHRDELK